MSPLHLSSSLKIDPLPSPGGFSCDSESTYPSSPDSAQTSPLKRASLLLETGFSFHHFSMKAINFDGKPQLRCIPLDKDTLEPVLALQSNIEIFYVLQHLAFILEAPLYYENSLNGEILREGVKNFVERKMSATLLRALGVDTIDGTTIDPRDLLNKIKAGLEISPRFHFEKFQMRFEPPYNEGIWLDAFINLLPRVKDAHYDVDGWGVRDLQEKLSDLFNTFNYEQKEFIITEVELRNLRDSLSRRTNQIIRLD